jgi:predicted GIY-YIG superfamily endonuclease
MKSSWVYILRCSDGSYYTGCTTNLEQRIVEHQEAKFGGYTSRHLPVELIWSAEFHDIQQAIEAERQIKGWSRKKKEALMQGNFELLHELAQSKEMHARRQKRSSP